MNTDALIERMKLKSQVRRWRVLFVLSLVVFLLLLAGPAGRFPVVQEAYVARVSIAGIIDEDLYRDQVIRDLAEDEQARAVIVYINSPGGTAAGGEALFESIRHLSSRKPTVAVMGNLATSAGYLAAIGANRIFAQHATITGSIGVIFQSPNVGKLAEKIGVELEVIKTDPLKGEPSFFAPISPEAREMVGKVMDDFHAVFIRHVSERRGMPLDKAKHLSNGRIFSGGEALELGLVDAVGTNFDAEEWLKKEYGLAPDMETIEVDLAEPQAPLEQVFSAWLGHHNLLIPNFFSVNGLLSRWDYGAMIAE